MILQMAIKTNNFKVLKPIILTIISDFQPVAKNVYPQISDTMNNNSSSMYAEMAANILAKTLKTRLLAPFLFITAIYHIFFCASIATINFVLASSSDVSFCLLMLCGGLLQILLFLHA